MFEIYAVVIADGQKIRQELGTEEDYELATRRAREAAYFYAEYACIRDTNCGTIHFIRRPSSQPGKGSDPQATSLPRRLH